MERFNPVDHWPYVAGAVSFVGATARFVWRRRTTVNPRTPYRFIRFIGRTIAANILLRVERLERVAQQEENAALKLEIKLLRQRRTVGTNGGHSGSEGTTPERLPPVNAGQPSPLSAGSDAPD